ncbi:RNA polymerase sigma factor SigJ [Mycolicibacterium duvalii]|uniref:RNA polymerase sigma factor SigJ n=2 Tax=Mycolicibacterium duvalii TaxID=39688 RepID=A0A7I7K459_9MYCO|nr:RNA polymerase sigma factor SigJ [Mycolicibacterium duvalii]
MPAPRTKLAPMTTVAEFEELRPHLLAVAYRLTGTFADAEDIVQEAWIRWNSQRDSRIRDTKAWLTTVVSRLSLDRLRSAAHRRESYTGQWLPEPVVTTLDSDPLNAVVAGEDARFAAMVVLENLSPDQRVAFVLHDGFAVPFDEIADVLDTTAAAARQLASRARRTAARAPAPAAEHDEVVAKFLAAMASGDLKAVVAALHPDVTFTGDADGKAPTAARVITGADKVARFLLGLADRYGPRLFDAGRPALVNGQLGLYSPGADTDGRWPVLMPRISAITVRDGRVAAIWDIANPAKFTASPLATARATAIPKAPGTRPRS